MRFRREIHIWHGPRHASSSGLFSRSVAMRVTVSDSQWELIRTALPAPNVRSVRGRPAADDRKCFEGILWILSEASPWEKLPVCYGSPSCVNRRFLKWIASGAWPRMFDLFIRQVTDERDRLFWGETQEKLYLAGTRRRHAYRIKRLPLRITPQTSFAIKE